MKNEALIRNMFGLTQQETAILLNVTRTQLSMYEIGQRDLPTTAVLKLAAVTVHLQNTKEPSDESKKLLKMEQEKTQEWLKRERLNLEYKKLTLERKITAMENKRKECFAALEVVAFLQSASGQNSFPYLSEGITARVKSTLRKNCLSNLEDMYLKKEHIDHLIKSVEQKMKQP